MRLRAPLSPFLRLSPGHCKQRLPLVWQRSGEHRIQKRFQGPPHRRAGKAELQQVPSVYLQLFQGKTSLCGKQFVHQPLHFINLPLASPEIRMLCQIVRPFDRQQLPQPLLAEPVQGPPDTFSAHMSGMS